MLLNYSNVAAIVLPVNRTQVLTFVARSSEISKCQAQTIAPLIALMLQR
ncbi:hypothetical protein [Alkalinema sp. FACHB-956]|nr:hypothetical protein [Alkalinema sp. FACHB-956]MBD2329108.1 hypothetical protein [Alkalinema sp. FACHB-956]